MLTISNSPTTSSERLLARAKAKAARGEDATYYFRAAEILRRIEVGLPVGHHRRRRRGYRPGKGVAR